MWFIICICIFIYTILIVLLIQIKYKINKRRYDTEGGYDTSMTHIPINTKHDIDAKNIVVDTLNMTYEIHKKSNSYHINHLDILNTIKIVTNKLKPIISGKIIFITKTNEHIGQSTQQDIELESYNNISKELGVYIYVVHKLKEPNKNTFVRIKKSHSTLGRDDFYIMITAWTLRCPVLGQDYYKDLKNMKFGELDSFYVLKYSPYKTFEERDYINPTGQEYKLMQAPRVIRWDSL